MIYMVPEIQSETNILLCYIGQFFALLPTPPPPTNDPKNQNFEKNEKNAWRYHPFIQLGKCRDSGLNPDPGFDVNFI